MKAIFVKHFWWIFPLLASSVAFAQPQIGGASVDAKGIRHSGTAPDLRVKVIAPVADGVLRCRPTFCSCGVCFGAAKPIPGLKLEYREKGADVTAWKTVEDFPYFSETKDYRGSILDLKENTEYEVAVNGKKSFFRTWSSVVLVGKTIVIDPKTVKLPIRISDRGTDDGWIRYTVEKGKELKSTTADPVLIVENAKNVLIENISFSGSRGRNEITIADSENIRVSNCRFSHWGRPYEVRYDGLGRPYEIGKPPTSIVRNIHGGFASEGGTMVNWDGAIELRPGAIGTVIERSWFHDCDIHANSWFYSHPTGGQAIMACQPDHSTVIRYNDFTGSDIHRWNDAVESENNFGEHGGLNRDADVYGNFFIFAADDCIELDGGQQNVRCFENRFESALCGVSIQGCMASPVYLYRNGFFGMCDQFGLTGQTIKTGGGPHGEEARAYIFDNLLWGPGSGMPWRELLTSKLRNNVFCDDQKISGRDKSPQSTSSGDRFGVRIAEENLPVELPVRPVGFVLDRARFSGIRLQKGVASPSALTVTARSTSDEDIPFEVVWNEDTPWIQVSPLSGVIRASEMQRFTITFDVKAMNDRRYYRGAFLVRSSEGLSRAVSLYAETDFVPPVRPECPGVLAIYQEASEGSPIVSLKEEDASVHTYTFKVPKDGRYFFLVHAKGDAFGKKVAAAALDDEPFAVFQMQLWEYFTWASVAPGNRFGNTLRFWDFKAGEIHSLRLKSQDDEIQFDKIVMTDNPGPFEPR